MPVFICIVLCIVIINLQHTLWASDRGIGTLLSLQDKISKVRSDNESMKMRNALLLAEIEDLKNGFDALEERARNELGMIKKGEIFYRYVETEPLREEEKQ